MCKPGDEPTGPAYIYFDDFMRASYIEAYLQGTPPDCELVVYEYRVIDDPSEQPYLTIEELENLIARWKEPEARTERTPSAKRRWHFWKV